MMRNKIGFLVIGFGLFLMCISKTIFADNLMSGPIVHVVQPLAATEMKEFFEWAEAHPNELGGDIQLSDLRNADAYFIDIQNNGKKNYVFATEQGSGSYLYLYFFEKIAENFKSLSDTFTYESCRPYKNQITKQQELFIEIRGRTYLSINSGTYQDPVREIFICEKGVSKRVCTAEWAVIHRDFFNQLYSKQKFTAASSYISGVLATCGTAFPSKIRMWMENDLALAQMKSGDYLSCLTTINKIKKDNEFQIMDPKLKAAVMHNEQLCLNKSTEMKMKGTAGQYNYSWLLEYKGKSTNAVVWDQRFNALLSTIVPEIPSPNNEELRDLKRSVKIGIFGPPDEVKIQDNRFIVLSACKAHECAFHKSMIWVDTKKEISAMAMYVKPELTLASRSIKSTELPEEFLEAVKVWMKAEKIEFDTVICYDFAGNSNAVTALLK